MSVLRCCCFGVILGLLSGVTLHGGILEVVSCSDTAVQAAVDVAGDGDVVLVPKGECVWTKGIKIERGITLKGAGIDQTVINDRVPNNTITLETQKGKYYRISGFTFVKESVDGNVMGGERVLTIRGDTRTVRIDHNKFDHSELASPHRSIFVGGSVLGVIDNNEFIGGGGLRGAIFVMHLDWNGLGEYGDASWAEESHWGTDKFIFIEDNVFSAPDGKVFNTTDAEGGGRFVFRHNSVTNGNVATHEGTGRRRGLRALEIYGNTFSNSAGSGAAGMMRSGTALYFNNTGTGYSTLYRLINFRSARSGGEWGACDGTGRYDQNDGVTYETGTHGGGDSVKDVLTDTAKNWETDRWIGYSVRNITQGWGSVILTNSSSKITPLASNRGDNFWNSGDQYEILRATACLDQIGRGKGGLLSGSPAQPEGWPHQELDPVYAWNNTLNGVSWRMEAPGNPHIIEGREFHNSPRPGYSPYIYPHPLVVDESAPSSPANLRLME